MKSFILASALALAALPLAAQDKAVFGYCDDNICGVGWGQANLYQAEAVCFKAADLAPYEGATLSSISFGFGSGIQKNITVFLSRDLGKEPFYTQAGKIARVKHWCDIELAEPLTIHAADGDLYIGFYVKTASEKGYQLGVDEALATNGHSNYMIAATYDDQLWGNFMDRTEKYGNACIRANFTGANLPTGLASLTLVTPPTVAYPGQPFSFSASVRNNGADPVSSVSLSYIIGSGATATYDATFDPALQPGQGSMVTIAGVQTSEDRAEMPLEAWVSAVNGKALTDATHLSAIFPCSNSLFERRLVVEEGTGTWCGNCPVGYVGLETMAANHPDGSYIGIAIHDATANTREPMQCPKSYIDLVSAYMTGYPSCLINRDPAIGVVQPDKNNLEMAYADIHGVAKQGVTVYESQLLENGNIRVKAGMRSAVDIASSPLLLSLVITEDNVGPYTQTNYFLDRPSGGLTDDFEEGGKYGVANPQLIYNDVARHLEGTWGIAGSLPADIEKEKLYLYETELTPAYFKAADPENPRSTDEPGIENTDNLHVIALLLDTSDFHIVNADKQKLGTIIDTAVQSVGADITGPAEYYNLQGMRVNPATAQRGIYIIRQGTRTTKVAL